MYIAITASSLKGLFAMLSHQLQLDYQFKLVFQIVQIWCIFYLCHPNCFLGDITLNLSCNNFLRRRCYSAFPLLLLLMNCGVNWSPFLLIDKLIPLHLQLLRLPKIFWLRQVSHWLRQTCDQIYKWQFFLHRMMLRIVAQSSLECSWSWSWIHSLEVLHNAERGVVHVFKFYSCTMWTLNMYFFILSLLTVEKECAVEFSCVWGQCDLISQFPFLSFFFPWAQPLCVSFLMKTREKCIFL